MKAYGSHSHKYDVFHFRDWWKILNSYKIGHTRKANHPVRFD